MINTKTFLITGVCGFIGSSIAHRLISMGHKVYGVDDLSTGYLTNLPCSVDFIEIDLVSSSSLAELPRQVDVIMHLAGQSSGEISFDNPCNDLSINTISTLNLIEYALNIGCPRFLYASSMSVYGSHPDSPVFEDYKSTPLSCYGIGKLASEQYLSVFSSRLPYLAFRMFNVYGPGQDMSNLRQGMVSIFLAQAHSAADKVVVKGSLSRFRDFIYIDDVVDAWVAASFGQFKYSNIYNLGTGVRTTVGQLLNCILYNFPDKSISIASSTPGDQHGIYASTSKLFSDFPSLNPFVPLNEGISLFVDALKRS